MNNLLTLIFALIFSLSVNVWARDSYEYAEMAKNRSYPGGAEESDLKIQPDDFFRRTANVNNDLDLENQN